MRRAKEAKYDLRFEFAKFIKNLIVIEVQNNQINLFSNNSLEVCVNFNFKNSGFLLLTSFVISELRLDLFLRLRFSILHYR